MGTIVRIADWFGLQQLVCSNDCVEIYNPKVVQSSMGSILRVSCWYKDLHEWEPRVLIYLFSALYLMAKIFIL
ncbi:MAG: TrmH family RNA methyltransferase [Segetibacter sp.]